jgi:hypothetical protein
LKRAVFDSLFYLQGRFPEVATENDDYMAIAHTARDRDPAMAVRADSRRKTVI